MDPTGPADPRWAGDNEPMDPEVAALMQQIEERVAAKRAAGLYSVDALQVSNARAEQPFLPDELVEVAKLAEIAPDLGVAASTKPGIGKAVGKVKSGLVRATSQPLRDAADRSTAFNLALLSYVTQLSQEVVALRAEVTALRQAAERERPGPG
jgi:hypothetical protein